MVSKSIINKLLIYCTTRESQNLLKELVMISCIEPQFIIDTIEEHQSLGNKGIEGKYINAVMNFISDYANITHEDIMGNRRIRLFTDCRKMAIFFIFSGTKMNKSSVARLFNKDHATILHALHGHNNLMEVDYNYKKMFDYVQARLQFAQYNTQNNGNENSISSGTDGFTPGGNEGIENETQFPGGEEENQ